LVISLLMDRLAKVEATRHDRSLELSAFGGRMGGDVAGDCNQDMAPLGALAPFSILLHAGLKHLVCVELGVLAQHRACKRGDKRLRRMPENGMACNEAAGHLNCSLPIERCEKCVA